MTIYKNNKNGKLYCYLNIVINCTNDYDGQVMILYEREDMQFVREFNEFHDKFTLVSDDEK